MQRWHLERCKLSSWYAKRRDRAVSRKRQLNLGVTSLFIISACRVDAKPSDLNGDHPEMLGRSSQMMHAPYGNEIENSRSQGADLVLKQYAATKLRSRSSRVALSLHARHMEAFPIGGTIHGTFDPTFDRPSLLVPCKAKAQYCLALHGVLFVPYCTTLRKVKKLACFMESRASRLPKRTFGYNL